MFNSVAKLLQVMFLICLLIVSPIAQSTPGKSKKSLTSTPSIDSLWREPTDISNLDLYYGEGGSQRMPVAPFKFIKKDTSGTQKKFVVEDSKGVKWKVKVGEEAQPETVSVRLLWAAGYYTDMTYYFPEIEVEGMPEGAFKRTSTQTVKGARMELMGEGEKMGYWKWRENPFLGTKEFDGLRVMMMLINNWDLKDVNNVILQDKNDVKYYVSDLGATLGKTGVVLFGRSKGNVKDFSGSKFVRKVKDGEVEFVFRIKPIVFFIFAPPYYRDRSRAAKVAKGIPVEHVKWIGGILSKLSDKQLSDAFRAADYSPDVSQKYVLALRNRIKQIDNL